MDDHRQVSFEEGQELASQFCMPFIETSAKVTQNVNEVFRTIIHDNLEMISSSYQEIYHRDTDKREAYQKMQIL